MKLFTYDKYRVTFTPEALLIKAFRDLVERDTTDNKDMALLELGFIYFFCDPRSDYSFMINKEDRKETIKVQEGLPEDWEPDDMVKNAMETYSYLTQTSFSLLLEDSRFAIDQIRTFMRDVNLKEEDDKGKPKYPINTIVSAVKQIPSLVKELAEAERVIARELEAGAGRMKAKRDKTVTEDGFTNIGEQS